MQDEMNATKVFHISDTHPARETVVVFAVVTHPQPCNSEQNNAAQWLQSVKLSATITQIIQRFIHLFLLAQLRVIKSLSA